MQAYASPSSNWPRCSSTKDNKGQAENNSQTECITHKVRTQEEATWQQKSSLHKTSDHYRTETTSETESNQLASLKQKPPQSLSNCLKLEQTKNSGIVQVYSTLYQGQQKSHTKLHSRGRTLGKYKVTHTKTSILYYIFP